MFILIMFGNIYTCFDYLGSDKIMVFVIREVLFCYVLSSVPAKRMYMSIAMCSVLSFNKSIASS